MPASLPRSSRGEIRLAYGIGVRPLGVRSVVGSVVGNRVMYADASRDSDFMVAPVPLGVETSWQLRSARSTTVERLAFGLRHGQRLMMSKTVTGAAEVRAGRRILLKIEPASAVDAAGRRVGLSYSVAGDVLRIRVDVSRATDYPVLVDPDLLGGVGFGTDGDTSWTGWTEAAGEGGFQFAIYTTPLVQIAAAPQGLGGPADGGNAWAELYVPVYSYSTGVVRAFRADVQDFDHQTYPNATAPGAQMADSYFYIGIYGSSSDPLGGDPVSTFNGTAGAQAGDPLGSWTAYSNADIAFCAQSGGGYDGGPAPLCSDSYEGAGSASGGQGFYMYLGLNSNRSTIDYDQLSGTTLQLSDATPPTVPSANPITSGWTTTAGISGNGADYGMGLERLSYYLQPGFNNPATVGSNGWSPDGSPYASVDECTNTSQPDYCPEGLSLSTTLPTGAYTLSEWDFN
ncbi:MAG: hypothetical protein ACRDNS_18990, partial [Trebonia sp.]